MWKNSLEPFQRILATHSKRDRTKLSEIEAFVVGRFFKYVVEPNRNREDELRQLAWETFKNSDEQLNITWYGRSVLYRARDVLLSYYNPTRHTLGPLRITPGTVFTESYMRSVSLQQKINSDWQCDRNAFDLVTRLGYKELWFRRAVKWKFRQLGLSATQYYLQCTGSRSERHFQTYRYMLSHVVKVCDAAKFDSVFKDNEKRRPIEIQNFLNVLAQGSVSAILEGVIRDIQGELDQMQEVHRRRISDPSVATIDFSNASSSISLEATRLFLPKIVYNLVEACRPQYIEHDENWFILNQLSSMGNGYTFSMLTLLLLCIARCYDPEATVFGDDVIIKNDVAEEFIAAVSAIGFSVNTEKSFINSPFRESCGAFYHDEHGYLTTFKGQWPEDEIDCIILYNKVALLARQFEWFTPFERDMRREIPAAMRLGSQQLERAVLKDGSLSQTFDFSYGYFAPINKLDKGITPSQLLANYQLEVLHVGYTIRKVECLRTPTYKRLYYRDLNKLLMYLKANRRCKDPIRGEFKYSIKQVVVTNDYRPMLRCDVT